MSSLKSCVLRSPRAIGNEHYLELGIFLDEFEKYYSLPHYKESLRFFLRRLKFYEEILNEDTNLIPLEDNIEGFNVTVRNLNNIKSQFLQSPDGKVDMELGLMEPLLKYLKDNLHIIGDLKRNSERADFITYSRTIFDSCHGLYQERIDQLSEAISNNISLLQSDEYRFTSEYPEDEDWEKD
jgi:hypothetical protein